jgi:hypothetical protein
MLRCSLLVETLVAAALAGAPIAQSKKDALGSGLLHNVAQVEVARPCDSAGEPEAMRHLRRSKRHLRAQPRHIAA